MLVATGALGFAKDSDDEPRTQDACMAKYIAIAKEYRKLGKNAEAEKRLKIGEAKCSSADANSCAENKKDFNATSKEFSGSCGAAGMSGSGGVYGSISCSSEISRCEDAGQIQSSLDEDSTNAYDIDQMKAQASKCPAISGKDAKKISDDLKDTQDEIKDLKEKIPELQKTQQEQTNTAKEQVTQAKQDLADAQKQCREDQKSLERQLKDAQESIQDQARQINQTIIQLNDQMGQAEDAKVAQALAYSQRKADIENNCRAYAIGKVNDKLKSNLNKIATSTYNIGDLNQSISKKGYTSRKRDQLEAFQYFQWCMSDGKTKSDYARAKEDYGAAEESYKRKRATISAQIADQNKALGSLLNEKSTRAVMENAEDKQDLQVSCANSLSIKQEQLSNAQMQAMGSSVGGMIAIPGMNATQLQQNTDPLTQAKQDLELAENRKKNIMQAYRIAASGGGSDGTAFATLMSNYNKLKSSAENLFFQCCKNETESICQQAKNFLASIGTSTTATKTEPDATTASARPTLGDTVDKSEALDNHGQLKSGYVKTHESGKDVYRKINNPASNSDEGNRTQRQ